MQDFIQFAILGLGAGAGYALVTQGMVVVYRGSAVVSFAHAGLAVFAGYVYVELTAESGWPPALAALVTILGTAAVGGAIYFFVIRRLREASLLAQVISTLGILIILESVAALRWGVSPKLSQPIFDTGVLELGEITVPVDRLILFGAAVVLTGALWYAFRYTLPGVATSAMAENRRSAATLGWSPDVIGIGTWTLGAALAAAAGILIAPITGLTPGTMTTLVSVAFAAALLANLRSFPLVLAGSLLIGVLQSEVAHYVDRQGVAESIPFFLIVLLVVLKGRHLPGPSAAVERFAQLGSGRVRPGLVLSITAIVLALTLGVFSPGLQSAVGTTIAFAIVMLSVVVLTGYAGQLSLAQMALGGVGTLIAAKLVADQAWPLELALLIGVLLAVPVGLLFAIPALRVRGVTLAIVTLGLGLALQKLVFEYGPITGGSDGIPVGAQTFFGFDIDAAAHPGRYAAFVTIMFVLCGLAIANVRRSRAGRRLFAVRANERAAAALGISVYGAKLYAFGLAAAIAALGGILLGFQYQTIIFDSYDPFQSIVAVAFAVIGGLGFIVGPLLSAPFVVGGVAPFILEELFTGISAYMGLIGGVALLLIILRDPDGIAPSNLAIINHLKMRLRKDKNQPERDVEPRRATTDFGDALPPSATRPNADPTSRLEVRKVKPLALAVEDLTVRFGGVEALKNVSLTVRPGEVHGLIGPNGAGKTTFINAATGFVKPAEGSISLGDESVLGWPVHKRSRGGVSRSFQSLELFEDLTVAENLQVACDARDFGAYLTNIFAPRNSPPTDTARLAIQEFGLEEDLEELPTELPYGKRRLLAIARAVASQPSVLMLDEPAAGLDEPGREEIALLIRRLADLWGLGVLLVEHDVALVMGVCDRVSVLNFGNLIVEGTPEEVRQNQAVISSYLGEADAEASNEGSAGGSRAPVGGSQ